MLRSPVEIILCNQRFVEADVLVVPEVCSDSHEDRYLACIRNNECRFGGGKVALDQDGFHESGKTYLSFLVAMVTGSTHKHKHIVRSPNPVILRAVDLYRAIDGFLFTCRKMNDDYMPGERRQGLAGVDN